MIIKKPHFEYLQIQRGEVSDHRHDFGKWKDAYVQSLVSIMESISPALPTECARMLDIGSGLGGIGLLLARKYGPDLHVDLVDGLNDPPEVQSHIRTFSNRSVALDFYRANGHTNVEYSYPAPADRTPVDLIVSFAAYCFHLYPPDFFDLVKEMSHEKTVKIFDVRRTRRDWVEMTIREWGKPVVLLQGEKFVRLAFGTGAA